MIEVILRPQLEGIKSEVTKFLDLISKDKKLPNENDLKYISKAILFQKEVFVMNSSKRIHYKMCMIYDILLVVYSLTQNSILNFYNAYRSYIENLVRALLDIEDDDETGVNSLFRMFKEKVKEDDELLELYNFIYGEYSKACDYIHSNIRADMDIYNYYSDIISSNEMNDNKVSSYIAMVKTLMAKANKLILLINPLKIESIYYRKYEELKFLIGKKTYDKYKPNLKNKG